MPRVVGALFALLSVVIPADAGAVHATAARPSSLATYHGRVIDLAISWEGARACSIAESGNACFDSDAEMNAALTAALSDRGTSILSSCATTLNLYGAAGFGAPHLALNTPELTWISLSTYSFSGITSSYIVGGCSSAFRDASNTNYPGNTSAGASASSMVSGWDNRITKVYIT